MCTELELMQLLVDVMKCESNGHNFFFFDAMFSASKVFLFLCVCTMSFSVISAPYFFFAEQYKHIFGVKCFQMLSQAGLRGKAA